MVLVVFCALTSTAVARLGETLDQMVNRFGPPARTTNADVSAEGHTYTIGQTLVFKADDWEIECTMINGVCAQIKYSKVGKLDGAQMETILKNESQGCKWTEAKTWKTFVDGYMMPQQDVREWSRADGAHADGSISGMLLTTSDYKKAVMAAKEPGAAASAKVPTNL
jgi:hypothetical protein